MTRHWDNGFDGVHCIECNKVIDFSLRNGNSQTCTSSCGHDRTLRKQRERARKKRRRKSE